MVAKESRLYLLQVCWLVGLAPPLHGLGDALEGVLVLTEAVLVCGGGHLGVTPARVCMLGGVNPQDQWGRAHGAGRVYGEC